MTVSCIYKGYDRNMTRNGITKKEDGIRFIMDMQDISCSVSRSVLVK